tara:strand:+ start:840 stop:1754 length:915 start_codon:yes stop_codon:yes gene_type:complete
MKERIFCIPRMGKYTPLFIDILEELNLKVMPTPPISQNTIKLGVKYSPEMICYPFKVILGSYIECLELGATDLVMYNNCGKCRLRHYYIIQDLIMKQLGYKFNMHQLRPIYLISDIKKLNNKNSYIKILKMMKKYWSRIKLQEKDYHKQINPDKINIGVVGEIFTVLEPAINLDLINRLKKKNVKVHTFVSIIHLIKERFGLDLIFPDKNTKKARSFIDGIHVGGHAIPNIKATLHFSENNIDGVIHIMPLTCMPESTIEPILNKICYDNSIPLLRLNVDETNSELNFETRIETFVELLKRKKR